MGFHIFEGEKMSALTLEPWLYWFVLTVFVFPNGATYFVHGQCSVNLYVIVCSFVNVEKKKECILFRKKFNCTGSSLWLMDFSSFGAQAAGCRGLGAAACWLSCPTACRISLDP